MATTPVARRYANALVEIGVEKNMLERLGEQLAALNALFEGSDELKHVLLNPSITLEERRAIVRAIGQKSGWEALLVNFALLLLDKDRFRVLPDIAADFQRQLDERMGNVRAHVTSATPLSPGQQASIKAAITGITGKNVLLDSDVDAELIGGVVTRVGSTVYDGSVRTQLQQMRDAILKEVS